MTDVATGATQLERRYEVVNGDAPLFLLDSGWLVLAGDSDSLACYGAAFV